MNPNPESVQKIALVTGGAVGIGGATSERLAADGSHVIVADIDIDKAQTTAHRIREAGGAAEALRIDVGSPDSVREAFEQVERKHGRCDILVNSAGIAKTFPFLEFPLDNWLATLNVNLTGTLLCSQHAGRLMARHGWGRIINIASVAGLRAVGKGRTAYGTSKAAVIGLTRQMAAELAELNITANAICPGPVDTPMTEVLHSAEFRRQYAAAIPAGRYGTTSEIAATAVFLASDAAAYINGVALPVDGGFFASGARGV
ncbi:SDR family NAD(P)-dependent oxidoreductase [Piscinibacter sakaiensis]|uniref:SDR family NAD(P)-dependent oxidoreductase n=1 Tax=Piscinibacter sakaiensis TaxID=1547922 RepID=UPI003AAE74CB